MKLYFSPGACSLASHIALHEAEADFAHERVDLKTKKTSSGEDFAKINPKGYVPALELDGGELLTENIAVLDWIAGEYPELGVEGRLGRARSIETLAFISTEVHKSFKPLFAGGSDEEKRKAKEHIEKRLQFLADRLSGDFLLGNRFSVADCYLFVMLQWASKFGISIPEKLSAFHERLLKRPSVQEALSDEGLA